MVSYTANFSKWHVSIRDYIGRNQKSTYARLTHLECGAYGCNMALTDDMVRRGVDVHHLVALDRTTHWVRAEDMGLLEELYYSYVPPGSHAQYPPPPLPLWICTVYCVFSSHCCLTVVSLWRVSDCVCACYRYYRRLFAFLDEKLAGRYAVVDLRAGTYKGLEHLGLPSLTTPFPVSNQLGNRLNEKGHSWYGKTTCCQEHDFWKNPCPEDLMRRNESWAYCPKRESYIEVARYTRERCG